MTKLEITGVVGCMFLLGLGSGWMLRSPTGEEESPPRLLPSGGGAAAPGATAQAWLETWKRTQHLDGLPAVLSLSPVELGRLAERLKEMLPPEDSTLAFVLETLARHAPEHALQLAWGTGANAEIDEGAIDAVLTVLAASDPSKVGERIARAPASALARVEKIWTLRLLKTDPRAAEAFCRDRACLPDVVYQLFQALAEKHPSVALERACSLPIAAVRQEAMKATMGVWFKADPVAALTGLIGQGAYPERSVLSDLLLLHAKANGREAADLALLAKDQRRAELLAAVIRVWAQKDLAAAGRWVEGAPIELQSDLRALLLRIWSKEDPARAMAYAMQLPTSAETGDLIMRSILAWSRAAPTAAEQWVATLAPGFLRRFVIKGWFDEVEELGADELRRRLDLVRALPGGPSESERMISDSRLRDLAKKDLGLAMAWAAAEPSRERRNLFQDDIITGGCSVDPERAAGLLGEALARGDIPPERKDVLHLCVAVARAERDAAAAARWAEQLPDGPQRLSALEAIASTWAATNPQSALQWALGLNGPARDSFARLVLLKASDTRPAMAAELLGRLPPNAQNRSMAALLAERWAAKGPTESAAAKAWLRKRSR